MKKILFIFLPILLICTAAYAVYRRNEASSGSDRGTGTSLVNRSTLQSLEKKDASAVDTSHLRAGLTPPTNKWFSGIALQKTPQTIFPTPLQFTPTENSFTFDLPNVTTNASNIVSASRQPLQITVKGAVKYQVVRYDELSVDMTFSDARHALGTVTLTAGVPYIYFRGEDDVTLTLAMPGAVKDHALTYAANGTVTKVAAYKGAKIEDAQRINVPHDGLVSVYAGSSQMIPRLDAYAMNRIKNTSVEYKETRTTMRTTINYVTENGKPTYYGRLPHQQDNTAAAFSYATIYGQLGMESGNTLDFTTKRIPVTDALNLSKLRSQERQLLAKTVREESNSPVNYPDDSYFGGKSLYRDAQLLQLAEQLDEKEAAATVQNRLRNGLEEWLKDDGTGAKSFYYDTRIHGIVGVTPSFGSEAFNDHDFHYGYFIYAAAILSRYDDEFRADYRDQVNLLVADIANYKQGESLPLRRSFDPYFGHSWASGSAPFADGNNQESVSEAINAWIGVELWAEQTKNDALARESLWMLSNEVASASAYWLEYDKEKAPYNAGYTHEVVSLNWGGKRDYATFFSAEPRAMLGIQLLPMSPSTQYLASYGDRITAQLQEARSGAAAGQFDDYLLMYESLLGVTDQLERAKQLPDSSIDGANSRSYLYAWIMSRE